MAETELPRKRQFSINVDEDQYQELSRLAGVRRASIAQIVREYITAGLDRDERIGRLAVAAGVA